MKNDNNTVDLDDFWSELISKSEWAKNSALKTPGEFKNLNILGSKKKNITSVPAETKVVHPQSVIPTHKKRTLLIIMRIILVIVLIFLIFTIVAVTYTLLGGHINVWNFRSG